jgi:hypothetical protein
VLKLCLSSCSHSSIKKNNFWKPCDTSEENHYWTKERKWIIKCPIVKDHHLEPLIRWEFEFKGTKSYQKFKDYILPALSNIRLPNFTKFSDYQVKEDDYTKFAREAKLPWNKEISEYELWEGEKMTPKWKESIPKEVIYNHLYLKEIRSQISGHNYSFGLDYEQAAKRYADY